LTVDAQRIHGFKIVDPTEGKVEQRLEVMAAAHFCGFKGFNEVAQLGVEQGVD
jgi:hypothetical protein